MVYAYKNETTQEVIEKDFPAGSAPSSLHEGNKLYKRIWGTKTVHIPQGWGENQIKYNKSPSRKKHYF